MRTPLAGSVLALALVLSGCGDDTSGVASGGSLEGRTFIAHQVSEIDSEQPLVAGTELRLSFVDDDLRAHAGCNHLFATIESTANGTLTTSEMGGTEMGCDPELHAQDEWVATFLASEPGWALSGDELVLTSGSTEIRLTDRRVADPDRPLEETRWVVDTVISGDTASSTPSNAAHLRLSEGQVQGFTGCNEFSGTYVIDDESIRFDQFAHTKMACEDDIMAFETEVLALSGKEVGYSIEARRLIVLGVDGRGLGLHADE